MVWFKVDDNLNFHPKVMEAGNAAMGLWVRAGSWCGQQLSDGWVPLSIVRRLGSDAQAKRLVSCGLWQRAARDGQEGFLFHEWAERQPTRSHVEKSREDGALRQRRSRERRSEDGPVTRDSHDARHSVSQRPDPTRPDPTTGKDLGGDLTVGNAHEEPPLYSGRCWEHRNVAEPPRCGGCADARKSGRPLLVAVPDQPLLRCLVHAQSHSGVCTGCAADEKAANA